VRRLVRLFSILFVVGVVGGAAVLYAGYLHFSAGLPDLDSVSNYQPPLMSRLYAGDSRLLEELATERRIFVPASAIPKVVKQAFISAEDQNFYTHGGVDPMAILRAAVTDAIHYGRGRRPIGASTITQQVAKNMLLGNEVSIARKAREMILASRIEHVLSKDRILELYLNEIYLGLQSYGVAAAAQAYFDKPLDQITLPEAAFLAVLPKAPNNYNPFRFPEAAKARRDWVLDRMVEDHAITATEAAAAKATPIDAAPFHRPEKVAGAEYFAEEVRRSLVDRYGADMTTQGGLVVRTTLDPALQAIADRALHDGLIRFDRARGGWRGPVSHVDSSSNFRQTWAETLAGLKRPPGMLPAWRLGVVIEVSDGEAKVGFAERLPNSTIVQPKVLPLPMSEVTWARPVKDGNLGPTPRRMGEVLQPGDVVMVEPLPAEPARGRNPARHERLTLRQIPEVQGAMVAMDPRTGRVLAMAGGWSFELSQYNRATQAYRQPGSSFKPYVYLTAMERGISPSQRFLDGPFVVDQGALGKWRPRNDEGDFSGMVPLRVALEKSLNLVTVRLADTIGMNAIAKTAADFHVVDNLPRLLSASLGAAETTVLRQAAGYASLDEGGHEVTPTIIDSIQDRNGKVIWRAPQPGCQDCTNPAQGPDLVDTRKQIADPASVFQVVTMMEGVMQRGTGQPVGAGINHPLAGKTGTTSEYTDAWFSGFSPDLVCTVWVGFDNPARTLGSRGYGATIAGPIWHEFMAAALAGRPVLDFVPPPGVTMAPWDSGSGTVTDAFKPGQVPGASVPMGTLATETQHGGNALAGTDTPQPAAGGVDSGMNGLY
jgi:penicillin-binding protein 1A